MTSTEKISLLVAILAIVGGTVTTVLTGKFQMEAAQAQIQKDVRLVQIQTLERKGQIIRERFETLMVEMSEVISYLEMNNTFPVSLAKERVAKCRKAAFALSAHAGPPLSRAALAVVEATNSVLTPSDRDTAVMVGMHRLVEKSAAELMKEFEKEVGEYSAQRTRLLGAK